MRNAFVFVVVSVVAFLGAASAHAQTTPATPPAPANGPLILERIQNGWVVAPDFKVTEFDDRTGELAGAYGGRLIDGTILVAGAGYWLANEEGDFKLAYGGLIVGWQSPEFGRIRFGGRGLVGAGRATLGLDVTTLRGGRGATLINGRDDIRFGVTDPRVPASVQPGPVRSRVIARDDFVVFEPQANISARLTKAIGVSCGVGYRETAQADILRDRLNGPTANFAIQFGF